MQTINNIISTLNTYWSSRGYTICLPYDMQMGAATFHPYTFFGALSANEIKIAYFQPCRRPDDNSAMSKDRKYKFNQYQVISKPFEVKFIDYYLESLSTIGLKISNSDFKLIEDNWSSPTLGAYGKGWEVCIDGLEVTQITNFDQVGGIKCLDPVGEIAYGIERLVAISSSNTCTISDISQNNTTLDAIESGYEIEISSFNNNKQVWHQVISAAMRNNIENCKTYISLKLPFLAYDYLILINNNFNELDGLGTLEYSEKVSLIAEIRKISSEIAIVYRQQMVLSDGFS